MRNRLELSKLTDTIICKLLLVLEVMSRPTIEENKMQVILDAGIKRGSMIAVVELSEIDEVGAN